MDRRNFLKQASGYALAAAGTMTGIGQVFASAMPAKEDRTEGYSDNLKQYKNMEHRNLGGMEVSQVQDAVKAMRISLTAEEINQMETAAEETGVDTRGSWEMPMI